MKYLLKKVRIVYPDRISQKTDILIRDGKIIDIGKQITDAKATLIKSPNLHVSIGWLDIGTQLSEPGFEERETISSLISSAAHGGYTGLATFPNTSPVTDNKTTIKYIQQAFDKSTVEVFPIASISKKSTGNDIAEFNELSKAGAIAFSDGDQSIQDAGLMLRALQYVKSTDKILINHPHDSSLVEDAQMHEGTISTSLGLPGIPYMAEQMMVKRDLELAHYAEAKVIIHNISSAQSIKLIKSSASKNLFASVAVMNLLHTDETLSSFNPMFKVAPPLRSETDRKALIKAVNKDQIQFISSNHTPIELENKDLEFVRSEKGASTLDTVFASLNTYAGEEIKLTKLVEKLAYGPREVLNIPIPEIKTGEMANLVVFEPNLEWDVLPEKIRSKSKNNPYIGKKLKGKVIATFNNNMVTITS